MSAHASPRRLCLCLCLCGAALCLRARLCDADSAAEGSRLQVQLPRRLFSAEPEGYAHTDATFGAPPFGAAITAPAIYANSSLCSLPVDTQRGYPRTRVDRDADGDGEADGWRAPYVLIVDRGHCHFSDKVRNAQRVGAAAVVIADNLCLCSQHDVCPDLPCEQREPFMGHSGDVDDISVPSMLVPKHIGALFKDTLIGDEDMLLELSWPVPSPDDRVEWTIFASSMSHTADDALTGFGEMVAAFGDAQFFTPHFLVLNGSESPLNCKGRHTHTCRSYCVNHGRYCLYNYDSAIEGKRIMREDLRRLCVWQVYGADNGIGTEFFDYTTNFAAMCATDSLFHDEDCIHNVFKATGIDADAVDACIEESGGTDEDRRNTLLEEQIRAHRDLYVVQLPAVFVNDVPQIGEINVATTLDTICAGFKHGTQPAVCTCAKDGNLQNTLECIQHEEYVPTGDGTDEGGNNNDNDGSGNGDDHDDDDDNNNAGGVSTATFIASLVGLTLAFAAVGGAYFLHVRRQTREQVRQILSAYMPLDEMSGDAVESGHSGGAAVAGGELSMSVMSTS